MTSRRALVTGASSGIGEAVSRLLAQEGYRVALLARRRDRLDTIAAELPVVDGGPHVVLPCDLTDFAAIERALAELESSFGGLDLLVNNAGIGYRARVRDLDPEELRRVFDTNVFALLLTCALAFNLMAPPRQASAQGGYMRAKLLTIDNCHSIRIIQNIVKFIVEVAVIYVYWNQASLEAGHQCFHVLGTVAQVNSDFVAR